MARDWRETYPRPQLVRDEWLSLDGEWAFSKKYEDEAGMPAKTGVINVPFCPESKLSGINRRIIPDEVLLYGRKFEVPQEWKDRRLIIHFGAVDQTAKVYVDGRYAGSHEGGYLPFSLDITDKLRKNKAGDSDGSVDADTNTVHSLIVEVRDSLDHKYPWGKQKARNGGMWYTPVSGIWQSVWMEPVSEEHVMSLNIDPRIEAGAGVVEITVYGITSGVLEMDGREYHLSDSSVEGRSSATVRVDVEDPHMWSPEDPYLYDFTITGASDRVRSYFAFRTLTIEWKGGYPRLCLNGEPYFFNGVLDQGYWHDGIYTPSSPDKYTEDILAMKSLGYNTLRKHIKIEPEIFYYECDRLGMAVFQDMVNNSDYSFFHDTVLPTIGVRNVDDKHLHADLMSRRIFLENMEGTVRHLYNHPSVCYWTIFNEGWGQFEADAAYDRLKDLDSSRFIDSTSGWFWQSKSDVDSYHVYFKKADLQTGNRPLVLSEFGGYACKLPAYYYGGRMEYGYRKCPDTASLERDIQKLYREEIEPLKDRGLSAAIYTQLSDVEDETNGLLTYDREVQKVSSIM